MSPDDGNRLANAPRPFRFTLKGLFLLTTAAVPFFIWMAYRPDATYPVMILMVGGLLTVWGAYLHRRLMWVTGVVFMCAAILLVPALLPVKNLGTGLQAITVTLQIKDQDGGTVPEGVTAQITDSVGPPVVAAMETNGRAQMKIAVLSEISSVGGQRADRLFLMPFHIEVACPGFESVAVPLGELIDADFNKIGRTPPPITIKLRRANLGVQP